MALIRTELTTINPLSVANNMVAGDIAIDGNILVMNAREQGVLVYEHTPGPVGSGYLDDTWDLIATLITGADTRSVAIDGDTIAAGCLGNKVALFIRPAVGGWVDAGVTALLTTSTGDAAGVGDTKLAVANDAVFASYEGLDSPVAPHGGRVYIWRKPSTGWTNATENEFITGSDTAVRDKFGQSIATRKSDSRLIVGAHFKGAETVGPRGGAYLFDDELVDVPSGSFDYDLEPKSIFEGQAVTHAAVDNLDETNFVVSYKIDDVTAISYVRLGQMVAGVPSYGAAQQFTAGQPTIATRNPSVMYFDANTIVVAYAQHTEKGYVIVGTIAGGVITWGTPVQFSNATGVTDQGGLRCRITMRKLDATRFALCYQDRSVSGGVGKLLVKVGTISGTSASFGAEAECDDNSRSAPCMEVLDTDKLLLAWQEQGWSGRLRVAEVSGTTVTFGTATTTDFTDVGTTDALQLAVVDSETAVVVWERTTQTAGMVVGVSGTTVSLNTPVEGTFGPMSYQSSNGCSRMRPVDDSKVALFTTIGTSNSITIVAEVDGTSIVWNAPTTVTSHVFGFGDMVVLDASTILVYFTELSTQYGAERQGALPQPYNQYVQVDSMSPVDPANSLGFGQYVAINETVAAVQANKDVTNTSPVYIFREAGGFAAPDVILHPFPDHDSSLGLAIDPSGERLLIQSQKENGLSIPSVLYYPAVSGVWSLELTFKPLDGLEGQFGRGLAILGDFSYVGDAQFSPEPITPTMEGQALIFYNGVVVDTEVTIDDLIAEVEGLGLSAGQERRLLAKLLHVKRALTDPKNEALAEMLAVNLLHAFINAVEAQREKALTVEEADSLILQAEALIETLLQ
jgi:hypothetical protein